MGGDIYFTLDHTPLDWGSEFRIRLDDGSGGRSAATSQFTMMEISPNDVPPAPAITSAYATDGNVDLVVNWSPGNYAATGVTTLELQISGDDSTWYDPSSPDGRLWISFGGDPYAPDGHVEYSGLDPGTTYYVRIRAVGPVINGVATYSEWSEAYVQPQV